MLESVNAGISAEHAYVRVEDGSQKLKEIAEHGEILSLHTLHLHSLLSSHSPPLSLCLPSNLLLLSRWSPLEYCRH